MTLAAILDIPVNEPNAPTAMTIGRHTVSETRILLSSSSDEDC